MQELIIINYWKEAQPWYMERISIRVEMLEF